MARPGHGTVCFPHTDLREVGVKTARRCLDCPTDISDRHARRIRCDDCRREHLKRLSHEGHRRRYADPAKKKKKLAYQARRRAKPEIREYHRLKTARWFADRAVRDLTEEPEIQTVLPFGFEREAQMEEDRLYVDQLIAELDGPDLS